ncbi:MAG TPA: phosphotransferase [Deinococcales bacterium]|nr:phosphotransferase [Deinococcales bacterium]
MPADRPRLTLADLPAELHERLGPLRLAGHPEQGATSDTVLLDGPGGRLVLKRARAPRFDSWLRREARVLAALAGSGLPVPRVLALVDRPGEAWLAMSFLPGLTAAEALEREGDTRRRESLLREFGRALALVHAAPVPAGLDDRGDDWIAGTLDQCALILREHETDGGSPALLERLRATRPAPVPPCLMHGDFTLDNTLLDGGRLSGIIDWAGGMRGDPRYDLTLATRDLAGRAGLAAFLEGYGRGGVSPVERDFFEGIYDFY